MGLNEMQFSPDCTRRKSKIPVTQGRRLPWYEGVPKWYTSDRWDTGSVDTSALI